MQDFSEELQNKTSRCEQAAAKAIRLGEYGQKLPALNSWLEEWKNALCASASTHYYSFFKIALSHRDRLDGKKPADFADALTTKVMSLFLGIGALDGKEIDFDGRVRDFIRHACEDPTNVASDPSSVAAFQLPPWASRRSFGDKIGRSNSEHAEKFVLEAAAKLTSGLRAVLSSAHRRAVIETAQTPAPRSENTHTAQPPLPSRSFKRPDKVCFRLGVIFRAIESGKTGQDYCEFLDAEGLTTPNSWRGDGCPESYPLAYQKPLRLGRKLQKLIRSEKSRNDRLRSKLQRTDPVELKRILEISRKARL